MTIQLGHLEFDHVAYDPEGDVLYLSVGEPREPAEQISTSQGHLVRYDEDGEIIGLTLVNARWLSEEQGGIEVPLMLRARELARAFATA